MIKAKVMELFFFALLEFKLFRLRFNITSIRFVNLKTHMVSVHKKTKQCDQREYFAHDGHLIRHVLVKHCLEDYVLPKHVLLDDLYERQSMHTGQIV